MSDPKKAFGQNLRRLRKLSGWSQEDLAFECELDRTYIGGVERGERNISLVNICRIAASLGVEPACLLDFKKKRGGDDH
jgi:transcriptional regulator with XRE-family HTH domain